MKTNKNFLEVKKRRKRNKFLLFSNRFSIVIIRFLAAFSRELFQSRYVHLANYIKTNRWRKNNIFIVCYKQLIPLLLCGLLVIVNSM